MNRVDITILLILAYFLTVEILLTENHVSWLFAGWGPQEIAKLREIMLWLNYGL